MLSYKDGYCWATNAQIAELSNKTTEAIKMSLSRLNKKKYIIVNTKQSRTPKRKIFTMQAWSELAYLGKIPHDCKESLSIATFLKNYDEHLNNFRSFKDFVVRRMSNFVFTMPDNNFGYRPDTAFKITQSGYIEYVSSGELLDSKDAAKVWEYLFKRRENILHFLRGNLNDTRSNSCA